MKRLPSVFISRDLSVTAQHAGAVSGLWAALGRSLTNPISLFIVSAQWETNLPMLACARREESFDLAQRVRTLLGNEGFVAGIDGLHGVDDGEWMPLLGAFANTDVPIVQLSVQPALGPGHHVAIGRALRDLPGADVLVIGAGDLTPEHFLPFFVALGAAGDDAKPERICDRVESCALGTEAYLFH
jgi:4,5-DOPA dioxygenase extradiol